MKDFAGARGLLVKYSDHYHEQHPSSRAYCRRLIGVVVDTEPYQENGILVHYPIVVWENRGGLGTLTHPDNVVPYRRRKTLPDLPIVKERS